MSTTGQHNDSTDEELIEEADDGDFQHLPQLIGDGVAEDGAGSTAPSGEAAQSEPAWDDAVAAIKGRIEAKVCILHMMCV